jgi:Mg2+-importing ATPase
MIRTPKVPFLQSIAAPPLLLMTGLIMAIGVFLPMSPLAGYFKLQALAAGYCRSWWRSCSAMRC